MSKLEFKASKPLTLGIELEWQILDPKSAKLKADSLPLLETIQSHGGPLAEQFKPEGIQSMIEINSTVHEFPNEILDELYERQQELLPILKKLDLALAGGGTHPFELWSEREIFPKKRYEKLHKTYGFLYKRFSVYGQHIHIGCKSAEDALYLTLALARFVPHFIALSAASPFYMGVDTSFDCSRLTMVSSFPTSGTMPFMKSWAEFEAYYAQLSKFRLVNSIKDLYWDIRPKPEFGTVELRICDSPLTLRHSVVLAAYAQAVAAYLLEKRPKLDEAASLAYKYNRFSAMRYGLNAQMMDIERDKEIPLAEEILATLDEVAPYAKQFKSEGFLAEIAEMRTSKTTDAERLREAFRKEQDLKAVVHESIKAWLTR